MIRNKSLFLIPVAAAFLFSMSAGKSAFAEETKLPEAVITVSGEGDASVAPDLAVLNFSVVRLDKTARAAVNANTEAMAAVISAMKKHGIESRDLQTSGFSIDPQYDYLQNADGSQKPPQFRGYQVINALTVRVRDLSQLGEIMDEAVSLGVNQGGSVSFGNADTKPIVAEARKAAMADALSKAKALTEAAGVKMGRIISISEGSIAPRPMPVMAMAAKSMADAAPVPVEAGENAYHASINVTIAINQ